MAKTLEELQHGLAAIEGKPALQMTPMAYYNDQIMAAERLAADVADRRSRVAAEAQSAATRELQGVTSRVRQAREQRQLNTAFAFVGLCFGTAYSRRSATAVAVRLAGAWTLGLASPAPSAAAQPNGKRFSSIVRRTARVTAANSASEKSILRIGFGFSAGGPRPKS